MSEFPVFGSSLKAGAAVKPGYSMVIIHVITMRESDEEGHLEEYGWTIAVRSTDNISDVMHGLPKRMFDRAVTVRMETEFIYE